MNSHNLAIAFSLTVVCLLGAYQPDGGKPEKPRLTLHGDWELELREIGGLAIPLGKLTIITFCNDTYTIKKDDKVVAQWSYTIDMSVMPAKIDIVTGEHKKIVRGIYDLQEGFLKICIAPPGDGRPIEFDSNVPGQTLLILKRASRTKDGEGKGK